jgi:PAS domain S-box-containing protein
MNQIAVILTDAQRRILWVNRDFETITGYELGEVMGLNPGQVLQGPKTEPDAVERIRQGLARDGYQLPEKRGGLPMPTCCSPHPRLQEPPG